MFKRLIGFILSLLLMLSITFPTNLARAEGDIYIGTINFIDLSTNYWANDAITNMAKSGVIKGYNDETFRPENPITREEFAALIARTFYLDLIAGSKVTFYDVQPERWSFQYVEASKDFLTGYYPPSGHAFFSPEMNATREDVAVALVKALGYTVDDLENPYILEESFYDVDSISPNLRNYVALAVEKDLFTGYPDYTFRGDAPINRAEVATLLYRIIKNAATDGNSDINLEVSAPEKVNTPSVYISGTTSRGATVKIEGKEVEVVNGKFNQGYSLNEEGIYEFEVTARIAGGKTKTVVKQVTFERTEPVLKINDIPETTQSEKITVSGTVESSGDDEYSYSYPDVYLNNKLISNYWSNEFESTVTLSEGENTLVFEAKDDHGKITTVTKTITLNVGSPVIKFDYIPETTSNSSITLSGTIEDPNDDYPKFYINDELINMYSKTFSRKLSLQEGENTFTFVAVNSSGKRTTETRTITLTSDGPKLMVDYIPETTTNKKLTVSWSVSDSNDNSPKVYVNDKYQYYGTTTTIDLVSGVNTITFKATNKLGKSTTVTKTIILSAPGPDLTVGYIPETTTNKKLNVTWSVSDSNDRNPKVYVNDVYQYYGTTKTIDLVPGVNTITFKATNELGLSTTVTKTITLSVPGPDLTVGYIPETTTNKKLSVTWSVSDSNDRNPKVYVNDVYEYYGTTTTIDLVPGVNTITFKATNESGLSTTVTKIITLSVPGPNLAVDYLPETTNSDSVTATWAVTDANDNSPNLYINDELQYGSTKTLALQEGINVFTFKAVNSSGVETVVTKTILKSSEY